MDRGQEFVHIATGEIGAADGASEECIAGKEEGLVRNIEADGAFGVAGSVED